MRHLQSMAHLLVGPAAAESGRRRGSRLRASCPPRSFNSERREAATGPVVVTTGAGGHLPLVRQQSSQQRERGVRPPAVVAVAASQEAAPRTRPALQLQDVPTGAHGDHWAASWAFKPIRPTSWPPCARIPPIDPDPTAAMTRTVHPWSGNEPPSALLAAVTAASAAVRQPLERASGQSALLILHADGSCGRSGWNNIASPRHPRTDGGPHPTAADVGLRPRPGGDARRSRAPNSQEDASLSSDASPAPAGEVEQWQVKPTRAPTAESLVEVRGCSKADVEVNEIGVEQVTDRDSFPKNKIGSSDL
jgi:hypothetical protein